MASSASDKLQEVLSKVNQEELEELLNALVESKDALIQLAKLAKKLQESGILSAIEAVVESSDEEFNAIARAEMMGMIGNMMVAMYMLGTINQRILVEISNKAPSCIDTAYEEFNKEHKKMGILEMVNLMRSPEFAAVLRAMHRMLSCMKK